MSDDTITAANNPRPAATEVDLSAEIVRSVTRNPGEQVTCRRVAPNHYRCNWWAQEGTGAYDDPAMAGLLVTTSRICRSRFLRAVKADNRLSITIVSGGPSRERVEETN